jgi:D-alanine-D-alanine ligase
MSFDHNNLNIAVILGGSSAEREVSLRSGAAVIKALKDLNIRATAIDGVEQLLKHDPKEFDAIFNILHGEAGENGELAGLLSAMNIKYTGCDIAGAVLSWNKDVAKTLVQQQGLKIPNSQLISHIHELKAQGSGPWIVKPNKEGSSVGLYYSSNLSELKANINQALTEVDSILIEDFIKGTECTVAIVNGNVLPVIRIVPDVGLYDYQAKYESQQTAYFCPSGFDEKLENALKDDAMKAFKTLGLKGWARIDFIVDDTGNRWFLEANTTPGMTETSLVPKAAATVGWDFNQLVLQILSTAFESENTGVKNV